MNATLAKLAQEVYDEEIAAGASPVEAAIMATCVRYSPEYRAAWQAGRSERLRERELAEQQVKDAALYCGNPEEWEVRSY